MDSPGRVDASQVPAQARCVAVPARGVPARLASGPDRAVAVGAHPSAPLRRIPRRVGPGRPVRVPSHPAGSHAAQGRVTGIPRRLRGRPRRVHGAHALDVVGGRADRRRADEFGLEQDEEAHRFTLADAPRCPHLHRRYGPTIRRDRGIARKALSSVTAGSVAGSLTDTRPGGARTNGPGPRTG